jgi:glycosyltransferase involved in cell wall biosynthesis
VKILHIDPDDMDNPLSGGGPVRTFEICRRLARRGHQVTVLTPTFAGSTPELVREGVRYLRLGRKVGRHGSSHHITFFFSLPRAVRSHDYDLLVEDFMPPCSATLAPLFRRRRPLIASVQWLYAKALSRQYRLPFFLGERYGIRMYPNFVVLTDAMKRVIRAAHPRARCETVPNAVDKSLFDIAPRAGGEFILYLGMVSLRDKGVDLLLRAYSLLPQRGRPPLVLAGHGFEWDAVRALVAELGLEGWVSMPGKVDRARRAELLGSCRFVCMPSRQETFGMVLAEACAAAKRVIAFDRWPMNEVAPRGPCVLVPPFEVEEYAGAMRALLAEDDASMLEQGLRCRQAVRKFDWDLVAGQQEAFYERVVNEAA